MQRIAMALLISGATLAGCAAVPPEEDPVQIKLAEVDGRVQRIERVVSNQSLLELAQRIDALQAENRTLRGRIEELENGTASLRKQQRDLYSDLDRRMGEVNAASAAAGTPGATASGGEQAAYTQAFDALKASNYAAAVDGFRSFLTTYPQAQLADNAQYWLGEAYYVMRDYQNAATAFRTVLDRFPQSRKAPDALLKLGYAQYELKRYADARTALTDVTRRYPDSEAAKLAAERLRRIPAEQR